ncbi:bifunctional ligaserepressor BirA [Roseomonas sp. TAS13]|uniref:biotin--[acetyl-CoA-carboxylase] ligase n=1 Tax=Roseomonas TaxID=125216 RepID=UPI00095C760A|nr:biotin--[acetyl-CoA-carboxylase] ligase [Roseomonas sp. TAS13]GAV32732.1 bifunctional ligaserepressor BirA [Roseomonas sp. TAS13]
MSVPVTPGAAGFGWRLQVHESLSSTQDHLLALAAAGEPEGTVALALRQTAGRGQHGRAWQSLSGNLHLSLLLRPREAPRELPQYSLLAAVALADAVAGVLPAGVPLSLKWPNDLLLNGAKCAGILLNSGLDEEGAPWIVLGIGVNLTHAPQIPDRFVTCLADVCGASPGPEAFARSLLERLDHWRQRRAAEGFGPVRTAWMAYGPAPDAILTVRGSRGSITGRFGGLAEDGALLIATEERVHTVVAGELAG